MRSIHHKKRSAGFTLIELLVVISIIGLLSVIVLASLSDARTKAQNTKLNEIALQYINAFNLMTNDGTILFPETTDAGVCLGYMDGEYCIDGFASGSNTIKTMLINYYPEMPKNEDYKVLGVRGVLYTNSNNISKRLEWYLNGNVSCPRGATIDQTLLAQGITKCQYNF